MRCSLQELRARVRAANDEELVLARGALAAGLGQVYEQAVEAVAMLSVIGAEQRRRGQMFNMGPVPGRPCRECHGAGGYGDRSGCVRCLGTGTEPVQWAAAADLQEADRAAAEAQRAQPDCAGGLGVTSCDECA